MFNLHINIFKFKLKNILFISYGVEKTLVLNINIVINYFVAIKEWRTYF